ncbi:MAG: VWA domain-containing protein [Rhodospirillales bacterium]|nr:VWA domain-containing protein [Rhodospirillales bacterium]
MTETVLRFAGALRRAGLSIGTGQSLDAVRALAVIGLCRRDDVFWTLHAVLVHRHEDFAVFEQAFRLFWREPAVGGTAPAAPFAGFRAAGRPRAAASRRVGEALAAPTAEARRGDLAEADARLSWSDREVLKHRDFEALSAAELAEAAALVSRLELPFIAWPTRRYRADKGGRSPDPAASLRASGRRQFDWLDLRFRRRAERPPPLVVLCDISGSMDRYARMFLLFLHALMRSRRRMEVFLFGTRLTHVTRLLQDRDGDASLAAIGAAVADWSGGTRIGACLADFNRAWGRRVLGGGAQVLLMTDGLDRDGGDGIAIEMARLKRSCRRLIWLNPLLRYAEFAPRAAGIKALIDHVDDFLPAHNLSSLEALAASLHAAARRTVARRMGGDGRRAVDS